MSDAKKETVADSAVTSLGSDVGPPGVSRTGTATGPGSSDYQVTDERTAPNRDDVDEVDLQLVDSQHYQIKGEHGRGGLGVVLRAHDRRLGRTVAVKELLNGSARATRRFVREMQITARLQHPSIVPVHEAGRWPSGEPFYTMKLVEGRSLKEVIAAKTSFAERLALLPNVIAVAEAVAYAHSQDVIHRDLKPSNVLIGAFGETVVIDWGLAKQLGDSRDDEPSEPSDSSSEQLTVAGHVLGTPAFMPPEQAAGQSVDKRADVYAIGALLYNLLLGEPPYFGRSSAEILRLTVLEPPTPLEQVEPAVPKDLAAVVAKAMARDPEARYGSAALLADELKRFQTGQLVSARDYDLRTLMLRWLRRNRTVVTLAAAFMAVLATVSIIGVRGVMRARSVAEARGRESEARANQLTLAQARASLDTDPTRALAWLKELPIDADDWLEARNIADDALSRGVARRVLKGHNGFVLDAGVSEDGSLVYSAAVQDDIRVWDAATGELIHRADTDDAYPAVQMSPDSQLMAYSGLSSKVRLWKRASGQEVTLETGAVRVNHLRFTHDSRQLVVATPSAVQVWDLARQTRALAPCDQDGDDISDMRLSHDDMLVVWGGKGGSLRTWDRRTNICREFVLGHPALVLDLDTQAQGVLVLVETDRAVLLDLALGIVRELDPGGGKVRYVTFSPDGRTIGFTSQDGLVRLMDRTTGAVRMLTGLDSEATAFAFSPDGGLLASGSRKGVVRVWSLRSDDQWVLRGHRSLVGLVRFSPDGSTLITGSKDKEIRLWPTPTQASVALEGPTGVLAQVVISPDGRLVAAESDNGRVGLWSLASAQGRTLSGHTGPATFASFSPDSLTLASADRDGQVRLWDVVSAESRVLRAHVGRVTAVDFLPDGQTVLTAGVDGLVYAWARDGARKQKLEAGGTSLGVLAVSRDGRWIAAGDVKGGIHLWSGAGAPQGTLLGHDNKVVALVFNGADQLVSASWDGTVRVWDLHAKTSRVLAKRQEPVRAIDVAPDGAQVALGDANGLVVIVDLSGGSRVLRGHTDMVRSLRFSPGGDWLVSASSDGTARLWNVKSGSASVLRAHLGGVTSAAFSPDGTRVATAGEDGKVRLWDVGTVPGIPLDGRAMHRWLADVTNVTVEP